MKFFLLLPSLVLVSAASTKVDENRAVIDQFGESLKKVLTEPNLYKKYFAEGALVSFNGEEPAPVSEVWDPLFAHAVKYDVVWLEDFVTETHVGGKCIDYFEYDNGCTAMYTLHNLIEIEDGKFTSFMSFAEPEDLANMMKCEEDSASPEASTKVDENRALVDKFLKSVKKVITEPNLYKECFAEGALVSMDGEEGPASEIWDPVFAHAVKYDFVYFEDFVTETHVGGTCIDYIQFDNGCSTMYTLHSIITIKDGKFTSFTSFTEPGDFANVMKCMPEEDSEKPTEKIA